MLEEWRAIAGYEGLYQVSNLGRIKLLNRIWCSGRLGQTKRETGELILKGYIVWSGYELVYLRNREGINKAYSVHRIVANTFIRNWESKACVNHIDGNKLNNCLENLEWCTAKENDAHARRLGLKSNKSSFKKVKCNETGEIFESVISAALILGVDRRRVSSVLHKKLKSVNKLTFSFIEKEGISGNT
jgi:hypothetical protein